MQLSVPMVWRYIIPETMEPSNPFQIYDSATDVTSHLLCMLGEKTQECTTEFNYESVENPDLLKKLLAIKEDLADKTLAYTLLHNVPNMTFEKLFDEVGPNVQDAIVYCNNAGTTCKNMTTVHTRHFPRCFTYATQKSKLAIHKNFAEEGISNGVTMLIMTGAHLASEALRKKFPTDEVIIYSDFINTYMPSSAHGMRLMVHLPDNVPDLDIEGINISPGHSTIL